MSERYIVGRCFTSRTWHDTGRQREHGDKVRTLLDDNGHCAFQKPGTPEAGSVRPWAEYIASVCGRWIDVPVPIVRLREQNPIVSISCSVGPSIEWSRLRASYTADGVFAIAIDALKSFTGVIVLDLLVRLADEERTSNHSNHIFCLTNSRWYSIDYAPSLWHPAHYGQITYQPELLDAMRANPTPIWTSLALAKAIPDKALDELLSALPELVPGEHSKDSLIETLRNSRDSIDTTVTAWCRDNSITL
jgi:hypothetical protein